MKSEQLEDKLSDKEAYAKIHRKIKIYVILSLLGVLFCYNYAPLSIPELPNAIDRIIFTIQWHSLTVLVLFRMVENVMFARSDGAWNPLDPKNNHRTEILERILSNTVEQFLLTVGSTIILSTYLKPSQMIIIPIFVIFWCLGRIVFELSYKIHPIYRSGGMVITQNVSLISTTMVVYFQFINGHLLIALLSSYFVVRRFFTLTQLLLFEKIVVLLP